MGTNFVPCANELSATRQHCGSWPAASVARARASLHSNNLTGGSFSVCLERKRCPSIWPSISCLFQSQDLLLCSGWIKSSRRLVSSLSLSLSLARCGLAPKIPPAQNSLSRLLALHWFARLSSLNVWLGPTKCSGSLAPGFQVYRAVRGKIQPNESLSLAFVWLVFVRAPSGLLKRELTDPPK